MIVATVHKTQSFIRTTATGSHGGAMIVATVHKTQSFIRTAATGSHGGAMIVDSLQSIKHIIYQNYG